MFLMQLQVCQTMFILTHPVNFTCWQWRTQRGGGMGRGEVFGAMALGKILTSTAICALYFHFL
jgi:hypothetical protein